MKVSAAPISRLPVDDDDRDRRSGYFRSRPVEQMSIYMLKESICDFRHCESCLGCLYGQEWIKRGYPELGSEEFVRFFGAYQLLRNVRDPEKRTKMALERMGGTVTYKQQKQTESDKLRRIMKENDIKHREVAEEIGYTLGAFDSYLSKGVTKTGMKRIFEAVERILERRAQCV